MIASASPKGQDALLFFGLRTILKARALHSNLRARAGFRDARSGTLHGVTSEASGAAGGAPCQWSERHRFWRGVADLPSHAVASIKILPMLIGQDRERASGERRFDAPAPWISRGYELTARSKPCAIIREDRECVSRAADRHIELLSVDEFGGKRGIDIDDHVIDRRALRRVRRRGVAVVDVAQTVERGA